MQKLQLQVPTKEDLNSLDIIELKKWLLAHEDLMSHGRDRLVRISFAYHVRKQKSKIKFEVSKKPFDL